MSNRIMVSSADLYAAIGALESWIDAFTDVEEPEVVERVQRVINAMAEFYALPDDERPKLRLVSGPEKLEDME